MRPARLTLADADGRPVREWDQEITAEGLLRIGDLPAGHVLYVEWPEKRESPKFKNEDCRDGPNPADWLPAVLPGWDWSWVSDLKLRSFGDASPPAEGEEWTPAELDPAYWLGGGR